MTDSSSCSLTIEGVKYDITSFQKHHPGGNVISFYKGLDATDVFHTFHVKSQRARNMLKSLKVIEVDKTSAQSDFQHIVEGWKKKGYYDSNHDDFILWGGIVSAITYTGLVVQGAGYPVMGGIITGIGWAHCGFVQHHAGHLGFTGIAKYDHFVQDLFEGILKGGSGSWWRNRHNKHHAMPNTIGYDGDLRTTPFFAWDDVLVKEVPTFLLRIQHIMVFPMLVLYVPLFIVTTKLFMYHKKKYFEMGLVALHYFHFWLYCNNMYDFLLFYSIGYALQGLYIGVMFSINHMAMPRITNIEDTWFDRQLISTCNWGGNSKVAMYVSGFLNLQIEHHIAPQMPPEHYHLITKDIQALAKKRGVPYRDYTFWEGLVLFVESLRETANKELALRDKQKETKKID